MISYINSINRKHILRLFVLNYSIIGLFVLGNLLRMLKTYPPLLYALWLYELYHIINVIFLYS